MHSMRHWASLSRTIALVLLTTLVLIGGSLTVPARAHVPQTSLRKTTAASTTSSLPTSLVPIVAHTLAARNPGIWRAEIRHQTVLFTNPAQHLTASFDRSGVRFEFGGSQREQLGMQLLALRSGMVRDPVTRVQPLAHANRVEFAHGQGLSEWYVNSPLGVEQGFTFAKPLRAGGSLTLVFGLRGTLTPRLNANALEFVNARDQAELRYSDLIAYDAHHRTLPSHIMLRGTDLELAIDAQGADYPITVDPLFSITASLPDPEPAALDSFGYAVTLSADGTTALIGAYRAAVNHSQIGAGKAYIFTATNGVWSPTPTASFVDPVAEVDPAAAGNDSFGSAVALSADGGTALIGALGTEMNGVTYVGKAYLFMSTNGVWSTTPAVSFTDPAVTGSNPAATDGDFFGSAVALSANGGTALIGARETTVNSQGCCAGKAYIFTALNGSWSTTPAASFADPAAAAGDGFGTAVALSSDGNTVLIGASQTEVNSNTFAGKAYVFTATNGVWSSTPAASFADPAAAANDGFGQGIALSADGTTGFIGAYNTTVNGIGGAGKVYVIGPAADLSLAMSGSPTSLMTGQNMTYMLTVANNDTQVTATGLSLTDVLPAGMTYVSSNAAGGTCANASGTVTCTLASLPPSATWQPSITVTATTTGSISNTTSVSASQTDPNMANNTATVTTTVTVPPPVAANGSVTTNAGTAVNGTLAATGTGPLTFAIIAQPGHGTVSITNAGTGAFTYTPASGYSGSDSFTFTASNSGGASNTATESVTVNAPPPAPPVATNGSVTTNAGTAVNGTLAATGTGPLTFAIVTQPGHGMVSITNAATGAFTYTPASGYSGSDTFTFTASNSGGASNTATESVTVNAASGGGGGSGSGSDSSGGGGGDGALSWLGLLLLALLAKAHKRRA